MASLPLEFHPDARIDAIEAYDWYAERSQEAADAFQSELQTAGRAIRQSPERWATYLSGTHRYLLKRFPFVVVYRVAADRIEIVAVAHGRRTWVLEEAFGMKVTIARVFRHANASMSGRFP